MDCKHGHKPEGHHHGHGVEIKSLNAAFMAGIILNLLFVVVECLFGLVTGSVGLLSDAGHNLSDVASLILAMMAFRLAGAKATRNYTYGYKKGTVLVSLTNAVLLVIAVIFIIKESIYKIIHPVDSAALGQTIIWVAAAGIVVNGITAWLFLKDKEKDLNIKGAFLHMAADALVSASVVVSGIIIKITGWSVIDPLIGLLIAIAIVVSTWNLLSKSIRLAIDGVPGNVDIDKVKAAILSVSGAVECHHLHIWAISTTENALTAHVVVDDIEAMEPIKEEIKARLADTGISHATIEIESRESHCRKICEN